MCTTVQSCTHIHLSSSAQGAFLASNSRGVHTWCPWLRKSTIVDATEVSLDLLYLLSDMCCLCLCRDHPCMPGQLQGSCTDSAALSSQQKLGTHAHSGAAMSVWLSLVFSRQLKRSCNPASRHSCQVDYSTPARRPSQGLSGQALSHMMYVKSRSRGHQSQCCMQSALNR